MEVLFMTNIQEILNLLKSSDSDERYNACLQLMKLSPLPPEAIEALEQATKDDNLAVSNAAKKIIYLHNTESSTSNTDVKSVNADPIHKATQDALATHKIVSSVYVLLTAIILIMNCMGFMFGLAVVGWQVVIGIILMPILIVGGCIFVSKYFINQGNTRLGYIILFSAPILTWLYLVKDTW